MLHSSSCCFRRLYFSVIVVVICVVWLRYCQKKQNILITKGIGVKKKCLYAAFESIDETRENGDASCLSSEYSTAKKKPTIFFKGVEIAQYIKNFRIVLFSLSLSLQKKLCSMSAFNSTPQKPLCFHPLSSVSFTRQHTCSNYAVDG